MCVVHKFRVGGTKGYFRVGLFEDGQPGELFINLDGSVDAGTWGMVAILTSMALQRGVPLLDICRKLGATQFEPRGLTGNQKIPMASSIADYLARWLWLEFGTKGEPLFGA